MRAFCIVLIVLGLAPTRFCCAVDTRPLHVDIVLAFPNLKWPDWVTGIDDGLLKPARPVIVTSANDKSGRMFVVSEYGTIHAFSNNPNVEEMSLFLDIRDRVQFDPKYTEEGLLGLAFHPRFAENGEFFVYYSAKPSKAAKHMSVISRFRVSGGDRRIADPDSEEVVMRIKQPYWNHNGGTILFGPDGFFYVGLGDGGKGGDPHGNAQNLKTLLGSILRIDVDGRDPGLTYAIPPDNPFVGQSNPTYRGEIWAYGLRNVWRMAFDRQTHVLWAADVGQSQYEEIDIIVPGGNYGWNFREGMHKYEKSAGGPGPEGLIEPIWEYDHDIGKSITGGCVYRGSKVRELVGAYLYADYVSGKIWALWYDQSTEKVIANRMIASSGRPITTFGEDDEGEVYFATEDGGIFRFASPQLSAEERQAMLINTR